MSLAGCHRRAVRWGKGSMVSYFEQEHGGHPDGARPHVGDGRIDVLGQARRIDGRAVGEVFVDTATGGTMVVVVRQDSQGVIRVEVHNRPEHPVPLDVVIMGDVMEVTVNDKVVYDAPPF